MEIYFSYGQFLVFDSSVELPGLDWTDAHSKQGFARRGRNVAFATILNHGTARVRLFFSSFEPSDSYERVIEVPIFLPSGDVVVGGTEEFDDINRVIVEAGHYRLTCAQSRDGEQGESIDLFFERTRDPITTSRIIHADSEIDVPSTLLEIAETAE